MVITGIMIVFSLSSMEITFPWYLWIIALLEVLVMVAIDHKDWLKEKQADILNDIKLLEEHRGKLINECLNLEKSREEQSKNENQI